MAADSRAYAPAAAEAALAASLERHREVMTAVPPELAPARDEEGLAQAFARFVRPRWGAYRGPVNRFIAAKAFASWTAYQGRGIATIVRGLEAAAALVRVEASRHCRQMHDGVGGAADRAHLVERQRLPLFEAGAEVDLDAIPGRDAVLLVAVVDDGVHGSDPDARRGGRGTRGGGD